MSPTSILAVHSSARYEGSQSRALVDEIIAQMTLAAPQLQIIHRDLGAGMEQIDEAWVHANFTPEADRTAAQRSRLALSDSLVAEIVAADTLVVGVAMYNFGVPSVLKAWIDQIARAGKTFRYTETGPIGLLENKRAIVVVTSGGTPIRSDIDFATNYMRHVLSFLGITDVTMVEAGPLMIDAEAALERARSQISALAPAA